MSRVAKKPLTVPQGVEVTVSEKQIVVKGPKGTSTLTRPPNVAVSINGGVIQLTANGTETALAGTLRALLGNVVVGVSKGFERKLELVGVGYRASMQGRTLNLTLGFSHPVVFNAPEGVSIETPTQTEVLIKGFDKQVVGETAAQIRAYRPPEPYKGKGVRYSGERITIKEAKKA